MYRLFIFVICLGIMACKGEKAATPEIAEPASDQSPYVPSSLDNVPDPTSFVTKEQLESMLGLPPGGIYDVKPNDSPGSASRSVFYLISDPDLGNAGMLISTYANPVTNEMDDASWAFWRIDNFKSMGEGNPSDPNDYIKYLDWDMGLDGAYNKDTAKYFWRDSNNIIYLIAFNVTQSKELQYEIAYKVGKMITP